MDWESRPEPFEPSVLKDPGEEDSSMASQARVLDTSGYRDSTERVIPDYGEANYQSHRNVYVGVHMPHSHSRHRSHHHRHRKRHHGRHKHREGNGSSARENGEETPPMGSLTPLQGGGDVDPGADGYAEITSLDQQQLRHGRYSVVATPTNNGLEGVAHPRYGKSMSLPTGLLLPTQNAPTEPKTPSDPCDRVKFILGGDHDDPSDPHDTVTHNVFTELEELKYDEHEQRMEWKETARWIKFEEDVEEGGNKWSKPHVATLTLHSLFELRSCIFRGTVLLDLQADNLATISDLVLDNLLSTGQLEEENRDKVRAALLQRHHHLHSKKEGEKKFIEHIRSIGDMARHNSRDDSSLQPVGGSSSGGLFGSRSGSRRGSTMSSGDTLPRNGSILDDNGLGDTEHDTTQKNNLLKKLPPGSEASNILVGEVDFLSQPIIAFVRLARGQYLGDITEVPIPTRFIFILLGPKGNQQRYHEIGRSISTLMSDEVFHEVAYKARNRGDLMAGIDEFLDKVTVLPPGEWDPHIRLEPPSKVPSQANRKNTVDKLSVDLATEPFKCKHCKTSLDYPSIVEWTKRPFKGLLNDMTRCYNSYRSDFREAVSLQTVAALILMFFANITVAFTFGAVFADATNNTLGATETILAVGIGNFFYSIFSGQPLLVLGPTGPTFIFEQLIFGFCNRQGIPFLEFRFWIGMWTAFFMFVLVGLNSSAITRLFTRFTEEIFTVLISIVFIYQSFSYLWAINIKYPYNGWISFPTRRRECDCYEFASSESCRALDLSNASNLGSFFDDPNQNCSKDSSPGNCSMGLLRYYVGEECPAGLKLSPNVFLMSVILFFGTFLFCVYFKKIRTTKFFKSYIRHIISDFAVFIAVVVWVVVDVLAMVDTPKLDVPNVFEHGVYTDSSRNGSFVINPLGNDLPSWAPGAAIVPALLATILLFMDQHITAIIVNRKDNKLKKHPGYHLDLFIIGWLIFLHSLLGLPWVVGATVLSISHVQSLHQYSSHSAPGESAKFIGVREQRVTLFVVAILISFSVMAYRALNLLPLPVLYGLVLYLGVASLYGMQFLQRVKLMLIPNKNRPDYEYLRSIPNWRIYVYTGIQLGFVVFLSTLQAYLYLLALFPILVVTLVVTRWLLGFCFSKHDIELLDNPIPDSLYCHPCQTKTLSHASPRAIDLEGGAGAESVDTLCGGSAHCSTDNMVVTSEPKSVAACGRSNGVPRKQRIDSFNITQEFDRCDLWRNLIKLDAPLPSPREVPKFHIGGVVSASDHSGPREGAWHRPSISAEPNRTLGTLEECDTDLESQSQLPDYESVGSPRYVSLQSPRDSARAGEGFPLFQPKQATPTPPGNGNRSEHAQWNSSISEFHNKNDPLLLSYQSTSV